MIPVFEPQSEVPATVRVGQKRFNAQASDGLRAARRLEEDLARLVRAACAGGPERSDLRATVLLQARLRAVLIQFDDAVREMRERVPAAEAARLSLAVAPDPTAGTG